MQITPYERLALIPIMKLYFRIAETNLNDAGKDVMTRRITNVV